MAEHARFIEPGDNIVNGVTAVNAFGHSAGHMAYHIESNGQELMIMSDTVAHYAISIPNPEWHFSMDDDPETAAVSRRRVLSQIADNKMAAIGFHMPFPSVGLHLGLDDGPADHAPVSIPDLLLRRGVCADIPHQHCVHALLGHART